MNNITQIILVLTALLSITESYGQEKETVDLDDIFGTDEELSSGAFFSDDEKSKMSIGGLKALRIIEGKETVTDPDNIMSSAFEDSWKDALVVADWTGSMYAYAPQILRWQIEKGSSLAKHVVFFNDGDNTPDGPVGSSGGIYYEDNPSDIRSFVETADRVCKGGNGGDRPENDLEAVLKGIEHYGATARRGTKGTVGGADFERVVLVADGNSRVRDLDLVSRIDLPVHIILCKTELNALTDYLKIAYETGGSVSSKTDKADFSRSKASRVHFEGRDYSRTGSGEWKAE